MKAEYQNYTEITKELLDSVQVGDLVKCNDWKVPYRVYGVSENYFVMARRMFKNWCYSVCEKKPWPGIRHNAMTGGMFHIGTDNWIFGYIGGYDFTDPDNAKEYLDCFENGETELSVRRSCPLESISIKKGDNYA